MGRAPPSDARGHCCPSPLELPSRALGRDVLQKRAAEEKGKALQHGEPLGHLLRQGDKQRGLREMLSVAPAAIATAQQRGRGNREGKFCVKLQTSARDRHPSCNQFAVSHRVLIRTAASAAISRLGSMSRLYSAALATVASATHKPEVSVARNSASASCERAVGLGLCHVGALSYQERFPAGESIPSECRRAPPCKRMTVCQGVLDAKMPGHRPPWPLPERCEGPRLERCHWQPVFCS